METLWQQHVTTSITSKCKTCFTSKWPNRPSRRRMPRPFCSGKRHWTMVSGKGDRRGGWWTAEPRHRGVRMGRRVPVQIAGNRARHHRRPPLHPHGRPGGQDGPACRPARRPRGGFPIRRLWLLGQSPRLSFPSTPGGNSAVALNTTATLSFSGNDPPVNR